MHEISLCQNVLTLIQEQARIQAFSKVRTVVLEIGALAAVEKPALQFGFEVVCKGSLADGARLEIIDIPATARCLQCECIVSVRQRFDPCPHCAGYELQLLAGDEMRVRQLEVD